MGNCFARCKPIRNSCMGAVSDEHRRVLRVVKMDGKVLEFRQSILVKDLLEDFCGSSVGVSKKASQHLPPNYELKTGNVYYLLPSPGSSVIAVKPVGVSSMEDQGNGIKRIKVVITKQQLQELLLKQTPLEVLSGLEKATCSYSAESSSSWKPKLESIPEGSEKCWDWILQPTGISMNSL